MLHLKTYTLLFVLLLSWNANPLNLHGQNRLAKELQRLKLLYPITELQVYNQAIENQGYTPLNQNHETESLLFETKAESIKKIENNKPKIIRIEIPRPSDRNLMKILLFEYSPFAQGASVFNQNKELMDLETGVFYRGIIEGEENSLVALTFHDGIMEGLISSADGQYDVGKILNGDDQVIYKSSSLKMEPAFNCYTDDLTLDPGNVMPHNTVTVNNNGCILVYFEITNSIYKYWKSVKAVTDYVGNFFNVVSTLYQNEAIDIKISELMVWTTNDSYPTNSSEDALKSFKAYRTQFNGNFAHLLTYTSNNIGGLAYVDVLCDKDSRLGISNINMSYNNFPNYSWTTTVVTHELGHNIGSKHTHWCGWPGGAIDNCEDTEGDCAPGPPPTNGGTIMSYCHLKSYGINFSKGFGPLPGNLIREKVSQAGCLGPCCVITDITAKIVDVKCNGEKDGGISVNEPTSGTPPYSYVWSNGATSRNMSGLIAGDYTVTITDSKNCVGIATFTVKQPTPITISLPETSVCKGEPKSIAPKVNGGTPGYIISWTGPVNSQPTSTPVIFSDSGKYTIKVQDANNCIISKDFDITYKNKFEASIMDKDGKVLPPSIEFCSRREMASGFFRLNGTIGQTNQYTYYTCSWKWGNGKEETDSTAVRIDFEEQSGDFILTLEAQDKAFCWSYDTISFLIRESPNELFDEVACGVYKIHSDFMFSYPQLPGKVVDLKNGLYFITGSFESKDSISDNFGRCRFDPISKFSSSITDGSLIEDNLVIDECGPFLLAKHKNNFCYTWYKIDDTNGTFELVENMNKSWLKVSQEDITLHQYYAVGRDCNNTNCDSVLVSTRSNTGDVIIPCIENNSKRIMIYPNPNSGQFYATMESLPAGLYNVKIMDILGRVHYNQNIQIARQNELLPFNLPGTQNGIYFIKIKGDDLNSTVRFTINH